jgi:predicted secreted protein
MDVATGIALYVLIWWISLFAVLPWGARRADNPLPGTVESAPDRPRLRFKFLINTGVAALLWLIVFALVESDLISFHEIAKRMRGPGDD